MSSEIAERIWNRVRASSANTSQAVRDAVDEEVAEVRKTLGDVESALKAIPQDALGRDQGGWFYRDGLLATVTNRRRELEPKEQGLTRTEHLLWILAEECAEVAQRASKAARFGLLEVQPEQTKNNLERIIYELNDLVAVADMIEPMWMDERAIDDKKNKVEKFLRYSADCGTLSEENGHEQQTARASTKTNLSSV